MTDLAAEVDSVSASLEKSMPPISRSFGVTSTGCTRLWGKVLENRPRKSLTTTFSNPTS